MKATDSLKKQLSHLNWHPARIMLFSHFILALIKVRTINLAELAVVFETKAQVSSNYKRLQRFFRHFEIDFDSIAKLIAHWLPQEPWILALDRTNWKLGKVNINILVLAVAYKGIAIPLFWMFLDKKGNSNTAERITLINQFLSVFSVAHIKYLTADREFKGIEWISYLNSQHIPFRIRIAINTQVLNHNRTKQVNILQLFRLSLNETMMLNTTRKIWGTDVYIGCLRKKDPIIIISNERSQLIQDYAKRWEIETLFGCLKTKGFNLEDTHLTNHKRLSKLFALLTITFTWCYITGIWLNEKKPIPIAPHKRPYISFFRYGLDYIRNILFNLEFYKEDFLHIIDIFFQNQTIN